MKLISIIALMVSANFAFANSPEFLFQASGSQHVVQAGYEYSVLGIKGQKNNEKNDFKLSYEYGISDMFSLGLNTNYAMKNSNTAGDTRATGFEAVALNFKGNAGLGFGKVFYGLGFEMGPEASNEDGDNVSRGNQTIPIFAALTMGTEHLSYGLKLNYRYNILESENEDVTGDTEYEEGHIFTPSVFVESMLSDKSLVGFSANYHMRADRVNKTTDEKSDGFDMFTFDLYGRVGCGCSSQNWSFLPKFTYTYVDDKINGFDIESTGGSYAIEMAFRKGF